MVQHIGIKSLKNHKEYKGNFADIYNLLTEKDISEHKLLGNINIYGDTVIKKSELKDFLMELKQCNIQGDITSLIEFIEQSDGDILLIGD